MPHLELMALHIKWSRNGKQSLPTPFGGKD
jgi:hypothetical protein